MNVWLTVIAGLALLLALMRLWFRWFSRRPLSTVDAYAVAVDTSVASVRPPGSADRADAPPVAGGTPVAPPTPPVDGGRFIPQQRAAGDDRTAVPPVQQPGR